MVDVIGTAPSTPKLSGSNDGSLPDMYRSILIPLQHQPLTQCHAEVKHALDILPEGGRAILLTSPRTVGFTTFPADALMSPQPSRLETKEMAKCQDYLTEFKQILQTAHPDLEINIRIEHGDFQETVARVAEEEKVDLVVVGARERDFLSRLLTTSLAESLTSSLNRPLLVVHPQQQAKLTTEENKYAY